MSEKVMENNRVTVIGTIVSDFTFSHAVFGEDFILWIFPSTGSANRRM